MFFKVNDWKMIKSYIHTYIHAKELGKLNKKVSNNCYYIINLKDKLNSTVYQKLI